MYTTTKSKKCFTSITWMWFSMSMGELWQVSLYPLLMKIFILNQGRDRYFVKRMGISKDFFGLISVLTLIRPGFLRSLKTGEGGFPPQVYQGPMATIFIQIHQKWTQRTFGIIILLWKLQKPYCDSNFFQNRVPK